MPKRKFEAQFLLDEVLDNDDVVVEDKITNTTRWSVIHKLVFKHENKFYQTSYSVGATEQQDETPWQDVDDVICVEVEPVEKIIVVYEKVKED